MFIDNAYIPNTLLVDRVPIRCVFLKMFYRQRQHPVRTLVTFLSIFRNRRGHQSYTYWKTKWFWKLGTYHRYIIEAACGSLEMTFQHCETPYEHREILGNWGFFFFTVVPTHLSGCFSYLLRCLDNPHWIHMYTYKFLHIVNAFYCLFVPWSHLYHFIAAACGKRYIWVYWLLVLRLGNSDSSIETRQKRIYSERSHPYNGWDQESQHEEDKSNQSFINTGKCL